MQFILDHLVMMMSLVIIISEAAAAACQLLFPDNKGISGILAMVIKIAQMLGGKTAKAPPQA